MISVCGKNWEQNTRIISGIHLIAVKHTFVYESSVYVHMCTCVCISIYLFPIVAITNYHKLIELKKHKFINCSSVGLT